MHVMVLCRDGLILLAQRLVEPETILQARKEWTTAIGESLSQARNDLLEGCNTLSDGDSYSALIQISLVARALDNIDRSQSSIMDTGRGNTTSNVPLTGGTSTSSVESATRTELSGS